MGNSKPVIRRTLALVLVLGATAVAIVVLVPSFRSVIVGMVAPVGVTDDMVVRSAELVDDHGELNLILRLELSNSTAELRRPFPPDLMLRAEGGEVITPGFLPNAKIPEDQREIGVGEVWKGELSWWIEPRFKGQQLALVWLEQEVTLTMENFTAEIRD